MKLHFPKRRVQSAPELAACVDPVLGVAPAVFDQRGMRAFYGPVLLGPSTLAGVATSPSWLRQVLNIIGRLEPDDYLHYLAGYYKGGLDLYGEAWRYADITTVLCAAAQLLHPDSYLEIGVRRGRSLAVIGSLPPESHLVGFDIWQPNYADMENPGPEFVKAELRRIGHCGQLERISGDSHQTVPAHLEENPDVFLTSSRLTATIPKQAPNRI